MDGVPPGGPGRSPRACGPGATAPRGSCTPSSGFVVDAAPGDRLLDPALGAGAMLDMGIYPLTFAHLLLGEAESLAATAALSESGIDLDIAVAGHYPGGALATMNASMTSWSSRAATIATDRGRIDVADFHHPTRGHVDAVRAGWRQRPRLAGRAGEIEGVEPVIGVGYGNEVAEVEPLPARRGCARARWSRTPRP